MLSVRLKKLLTIFLFRSIIESLNSKIEIMFEHLTWLLPALKESYKSREDFKEIWRKAFGKQNIVFTGLAGTGKSVLFDYLRGEGFKQGYKPPKPSQSVEKGKIRKSNKRMAISVLP